MEEERGRPYAYKNQRDAHWSSVVLIIGEDRRASAWTAAGPWEVNGRCGKSEEDDRKQGVGRQAKSRGSSVGRIPPSAVGDRSRSLGGRMADRAAWAVPCPQQPT